MGKDKMQNKNKITLQSISTETFSYRELILTHLFENRKNQISKAARTNPIMVTII